MIRCLFGNSKRTTIRVPERMASSVLMNRPPLLILARLRRIRPGPLLALALLRYRDRDAQLLFLSAIMPQRWFFDSFILWLIPQSRREMVWTVFFSWGAGIWRWYHIPHSFTEVGRWTVIFLYLPMLVVVLLRKKLAEPALENQGS